MDALAIEKPSVFVLRAQLNEVFMTVHIHMTVLCIRHAKSNLLLNAYYMSTVSTFSHT